MTGDRRTKIRFGGNRFRTSVNHRPTFFRVHPVRKKPPKRLRRGAGLFFGRDREPFPRARVIDRFPLAKFLRVIQKQIFRRTNSNRERTTHISSIAKIQLGGRRRSGGRVQDARVGACVVRSAATRRGGRGASRCRDVERSQAVAEYPANARESRRGHLCSGPPPVRPYLGGRDGAPKP